MKINYLKKALFPSFEYKFSSRFGSALNLDNLRSMIKERATFSDNNKNGIIFKLKSSEIFGVLSFGKLYFDVSKRGDKYDIIIIFLNYLFLSKIISIFFSILCLFSFITTKNIESLIAILPGLIIINNILYWNVISVNGVKIRKWFYSFEE